MDSNQYLLYLSHSWLPEHVELNIALWRHLWADCWLLVDENTAENPPYYVSRIEHHLRRSDGFVAVIPPTHPRGSGGGDPAGSVSPYIRFEIALAERVGLPRLLLVDPASGWKAGTIAKPGTLQLTVDLDALAKGVEKAVWAEVRTWLDAVKSAGPPKPQRSNARAAILMPPSAETTVLKAVESALRESGYTDPCRLSGDRADVEIMEILRETDVLVADVGSPSTWDLYGLAHALAVPTIRLAGTAPGAVPSVLPALTRGHAQGYDQDVIRWETVDDLTREIGLRARALRHRGAVVDTLEEGCAHFKKRAHPPG